MLRSKGSIELSALCKMSGLRCVERFGVIRTACVQLAVLVAFGRIIPLSWHETKGPKAAPTSNDETTSIVKL